MANKPPLSSFEGKPSLDSFDSVKQSQPDNSNILSSLLAQVKPNQVGYSVAGGTVPQDIGGMLANKVTGQNTGIGGIAPQAEGMRQTGTANDIVTDIVSDPLTYIGLGASKEAVGGLIKAETKLQKATKAKEALDTLRSTLGQAKSLAIKEVENVPVKLDLSGASDKVVKAVKNPIYEVQFEKDGSLVNNIGNMDKVKEAVGELINTEKVWEEAPNKELRLVKQLYGQINTSMKSAAREAGKPIDKALDAYHTFMDRYYLVNRSLVDSAGNAMGNKLRNTFRIGAEPAVKQAWKDVSQASPEIRKVMNNMKGRELIGNLLKVAGYGGGGIYVAKKLGTIAGNTASGSSYDESQ